MKRITVRRGNFGIWRASSGVALLLAVAAPAIRAASVGTWQPVGSTTVARTVPQVIPLMDGTVLVTGGVGQAAGKFTPLAAAERFDPKTNQFTALPAMATVRDDSHRAVRLADGRVLVTGGSDFKVHLSLAELFDPSTGKFSSAGNMLLGRSAHTSTLLPDGRVLIAGGYSNNGPETTAELFDPATGQFTKTGSMAHGRYRHAAVALADGRVAILGGYDPKEHALASIEIYDPQAGTFRSGGQLDEPRGDLTATLAANGRIIAAGGYYSDAAGDLIGVRRSVESYDPGTGESTITAGLADERADHISLALPDGAILVAAGNNDPNWTPTSVLQSADLVDPTTGKVSAAAPMNVGRDGPGAALLPDGRVLVMGGVTWQGKPVVIDSAEVFTP